MNIPRALVIALLGGVVGAGVGIELGIKGLLDPSMTEGTVGTLVALSGGILLLALVAMPRSSGPTTVQRDPGNDADLGWAEFRRELRRTRRAARPMTVLRIPASAPPAGIDPDLLTMRAQHLAGELRLIDRIWVDDGSLYVLLPESQREAAAAVIGRIAARRPDLLSSDLQMATFPDDGLTSGALISAIHGSATRHVPTPIRATVIDVLDEELDAVAPSRAALP